MNVNKHWNAPVYDQKHAFVFKYGADLLPLLNPQVGERIIDLGAGTGHLTRQIADAGATVFGIDKSAEMIALAQKNYPELPFSVADGIDFQVDALFDAVFSNATLHWITDADAVIRQVRAALKPGGRFVAEMGGRGNVNRILTALDNALTKRGHAQAVRQNYFPSLGEYTTRLEINGFRVTLAMHFDRETLLDDPETGIADWIRMFRGEALSNLSADEQTNVLAEVNDIVRPTNFYDGRWWADYKRLRFVAIAV